MNRLPSLIAALACILAVVEAQEPKPVSGPELVTLFKQELQKALREGLAEGPAKAITVCQVKAPEIADSLSHDGILLGRTSHRLRNETNTAPEWVLRVLEAYEEESSERTATTVSLAEDREGYVEPIVVAPLCLKCHGSELEPDVAARLAELYPEDRAVGYEAGDLRGVFWAEYPKTEAE